MSKIFSSQKFLLLICSAIFLLSIFLRSTIDIGSDTGFYLDLGKKISEGKKYYYDFFESNFPLSFYFYALQYRLSVLTGINQIIMSEIFINILAILSIFFAAKILQRSSFYKERQDHYNIIIISFCLGFFLRIAALENGEFGTKTSFLLILLYPYLSYTFLEKEKLKQKDLIWRGILMGLIPCLKPHYAILIIVLEFHRFWQTKSPRFFIELDKLIALVILVFYLNFMIKFTPEFFEFMVPMWSSVYTPYDSGKDFFNNMFRHLANKIFFLALIIPMFLHLQFSKIDQILLLIFCSVVTLLLLESMGTVDQEVVFYALTTVVLFKFSYDFFSSKYFSWKENKFIILALILIPIFDITNFPPALFGIMQIWFIVVPIIFIFSKKHYSVFVTKLPLYFILTAASLLILMQYNKNISLLVNIISLSIFIFIYEKSYAKIHNKFSLFLIFAVLSVNSYFAFLYVASIKTALKGSAYLGSPSKISDDMANSIKLYAPSSQDSYLSISYWIAHQFPMMNYLNKENYFKYAVMMFRDFSGYKTHTMFSTSDPNKAFVYSYLFDDFKKQLINPDVKIIFVNQGENLFGSKAQCNASALEYYLQDSEFRKIFLQNFSFKNRIIKYKKSYKNTKVKSQKSDIFDSVKPSKEKLIHDLEVYVRK